MNILVNFSKNDPTNRFSDVKLADFGETSHVESDFAKKARPISASIWRSPEAQMRINSGWNTATDIWSFGLCVSNLCPSVFGYNFCKQTDAILKRSYR
jgi:serine/threonine protein kinase